MQDAQMVSKKSPHPRLHSNTKDSTYQGKYLDTGILSGIQQSLPDVRKHSEHVLEELKHIDRNRLRQNASAQPKRQRLR